EWIVRCYHGELKERGNQVQAILKFSVLGRYVDGNFRRQNEGVVLKQWYFLSEIENREDEEDIELDIEPGSKYGLAWALAMERPFKSGENPSPKAFEKKTYRVDIGFRSNTGRTFSYRNVGRKKDESDFLRVHEIREKVDEKTLTHTHAPLTSLNSYNSDSVI